MISRLFRFSALLTLTASAAHAQTSDAAILGSVRNNSGGAIAGVAITALNTSTGNTWTVQTNTSGRFAFVQLPLGGPYTISAKRIGFYPEARSGYELTLGKRVIVDFDLRPAAAELAAISVEGQASESRTSTLGGNLRIDARTLSGIPALNRNFTDMASLAPTTGVQSSMLGQRWTTTDVRIDGVQARNMLRAGEFGAGPFTVSMEAIREFEVSTSVYDVTQGRQGGGSIRAATKSGTNEWTGDVFSYYKGSGISASTDFQGKTRSQREFGAVQWGGSVGGPFIKDKAHIFVAFDRQDSNEPLFTGVVQSATDEIANGVPRDSLNRLVEILASTYGLDTTRAQIGRLDRVPAANTVFARLDYVLSSKHRFTLSENLNAWDSPLSGGVDQPITLFEARSNYHSLEQQAVATLHSTFLSGLQNDASFALSTSRRKLEPNSILPRGFARIQSTLPDGSHGDIRVQFGGNRLAPDDSRETQLQLIDHAYVQRGNVLFTFGTDNTLTSLTTYIAESQGGLFEFQSLADLANKKPFRYTRTLPLTDTKPTTHQHVLELGAFTQAEWRPSNRMTATLGLRWDGTAFLTAPAENALVEQVLNERTDRKPSDWTKIQPRGQVVWDVDGGGRNVVRIGGGRFAAQPIYYLQHNQLLNDGSRIADISFTTGIPVPDFTAYRNDPSTIPGLATGAPAPAPYVNLVDPDFRIPGVWKGSASYRRRVGSRVSLTGTVLGSRMSDGYMYIDRNLRATPSFTLDNEEGRSVFVPASTIDAQGRTSNTKALANTQLGRVLELTTTGRASQYAGIVEASVTLPHHGRADVSYTNNHASDNTTFGCCLARTSTTYTAIKSDPRDLSASWGPSDTDFRHKIVVATTIESWWGIQFGARYVGTNGRPFSAIVNGDINGDEATSNDLAFVFDPDDPNTPAAVAASMRKVLANTNNVARDYLKDNLGHIASRNGVFAPWIGHVDVRFTKKIHTVRGQAAEVGLDIFNFGNLLNSKWGAEYQLPVGISNQNPVVQRVPLLNVVGFDQATHRYTYTVNENFGVLTRAGTPYQMQLSVRYIF